jgi:hypothetical protein
MIGDSIISYHLKNKTYPQDDHKNFPDILTRKKDSKQIFDSYKYFVGTDASAHQFNLYWVGLNGLYEEGANDDADYWKICHHNWLFD